MNNIDIVHEDKHLIAVNKSVGVPSQGDISGDKDLRSLVINYLKDEKESSRKPFCGLIHRLDRPTSGLILFAKTPKALKRMNQKFKEHQVQKVYLCVSHRKAKSNFGLLENYLYKDSKKNKSYVTSESGRSKFASLAYEFLAEADGNYLYAIRPSTGRSHQIRVQMAHISCPLFGDRKYGGQIADSKDIFGLHAYQLTFEHPVSKEDLTLRCTPPQNALWNSFTIDL